MLNKMHMRSTLDFLISSAKSYFSKDFSSNNSKTVSSCADLEFHPGPGEGCPREGIILFPKRRRSETKPYFAKLISYQILNLPVRPPPLLLMRT